MRSNEFFCARWIQRKASRRNAAGLLFASLFFFAPLAKAEVKLPTVLGDNMVLQRELPAPIWGTAAAGEDVTVKFAGQTKSAKAGADGKWLVKLDPLKASAEPAEMTVSGTNTIVVKNVLVGEVWLCSGQSNMEFTIFPNRSFTGLVEAEAVRKAADDPNFRFIRIPRSEPAAPLEELKAKWLVCTPENIENAGPVTNAQNAQQYSLSAIAYYFARELQGELKVPVGILDSAYAGSRIEPWINLEGYEAIPELKMFAEGMKQTPQKTVDATKSGTMYNGMIEPQAPFAIRGVLWYQGESNIIACNDGLRYVPKMKALMAGWRAVWGEPEMPFYSAQLAPFYYTKRKDHLAHNAEALPELWEAQNRIAELPHSGLAATIDLVENFTDIHPRDKKDLAHRFVLLAMSRTYGKAGLVDSGPVFKKADFAGGKATLGFGAIGGGLVSKDGKPLTDFTIAGVDKKFVPAEAKIEGDKIVVSSPEVANPAAVRFAWTETAQPNLFNKDGLPAMPFRTDDWPSSNEQSKME